MRRIIIKRKTCFTILFCLLILSIIGCSNKNIKSKSETESETTNSSVETESETANISAETDKTRSVVSNKILAKVFENKKKFYDIETQKYIYLREYNSTNYMVCNNNGKYKYDYYSNSKDENLKIMRWCEFDMDSDGEEELLLEYSSSNILMLHIEEDIVYGYVFTYRGMNSIKTDGSFHGSGSAADTSIGKIKFVGRDCFYEELCERDELFENKRIYRIDGQPSTKEEVYSYLEEQEKKENILWNDVESK